MWGSAALRGLLISAAFLVLAFQVALPSGLVGGVVGSGLGALAAALLFSLRVRLAAQLGLAVLVAAAGRIAASGVTGTGLGAGLLGLRGSLELADFFVFGSGVFAVALGLGALSVRFPVARAAEAALAVVAVAVPVAAHRDGMIARPLELADWFWQRGLDPVIAFLGLGAMAVLIGAGTLSRGRRPARTLLRLAALGLLAGLLAVPLYERAGDPEILPRGGGAGEGQRAQGEEGDGDGRPSSSMDQLEDGQSDGKEQRPVAVVIFHKDVEPFGGVFYFRHAAFSQFNGTRLVETTRPDIDQDSPWRFPMEKTAVPGPAEGTKGRTSVATDVALITEHRRMFSLIDPVLVEPKPNPSPARFKRAYRVVSSVVNGDLDVLLGRNPGDPAWTSDQWHHYTAMPEDPRYLELAARLDQQLDDEYREDPMARALVVKRYLEETTIYAFGQVYEGPDPTAEFLFTDGDRKGFCTHLSHAAAFLLRALGVPSRVSAGYAVMAENLRGGSALLVKAGDAHAWVEIHLEGLGWVPVEIAPDRTEFEPPPFQEDDLQSLLGEMAREEGRQEFAPPAELQRWGEALAALRRALPLVLLGLLALLHGIRWVRWLRPSLSPEAVRPAYLAALDRLSAVGLVRAQGESRTRFAERLSELAPSLGPLTDLLEAEALGGHRRGRAPGGLTASGLADALGRELGAALPRWRRLLAALHPAPWLWTK